MAFKMKMKGFPKVTVPQKPKSMMEAEKKEPKKESYKVPTNYGGYEGFDTRKIDPGFEDPLKIQELQRRGITPDSQKFGKNKKK